MIREDGREISSAPVLSVPENPTHLPLQEEVEQLKLKGLGFPLLPYKKNIHSTSNPATFTACSLINTDSQQQRRINRSLSVQMATHSSHKFHTSSSNGLMDDFAMEQQPTEPDAYDGGYGQDEEAYFSSPPHANEAPSSPPPAVPTLLPFDLTPSSYSSHCDVEDHIALCKSRRGTTRRKNSNKASSSFKNKTKDDRRRSSKSTLTKARRRRASLLSEESDLDSEIEHNSASNCSNPNKSTNPPKYIFPWERAKSNSSSMLDPPLLPQSTAQISLLDDHEDSVLQPPKTRRQSIADLPDFLDPHKARATYRRNTTDQDKTKPKKLDILSLAPAHPINNALLEQGHESDLANTIPFRNALIYLTKTLLKRTAIKHSVTIVPPPSWPAKHRTEFLKWCVSTLGFALRSAGGGVDFVQVSADRAIKVKNALESLLQWQAHHNKVDPIEPVQHTSQPQPQDLPKQIFFIPDASRRQTFRKSKSPLPMILSQSKLEDCPNEEQEDEEMNNLMDSLHLQSNDKEDSAPATIQVILDTSYELQGRSSTGSSFAVPCNDSVLSLESTHLPHQVTTAAIAAAAEQINGTTPSPIWAGMRSNGNHRQNYMARHHAHLRTSSRSLSFATVCADPPEPMSCTKSPLEPTRQMRELSFSEEEHGFPVLCASTSFILAEHSDHVSPLPTFVSQHPLGRAINLTSASTPAHAYLAQWQNGGGQETPMVKRDVFFSCAQHPNTRDWGVSERCDESILFKLTQRFLLATAHLKKSRSPDQDVSAIQSYESYSISQPLLELPRFTESFDYKNPDDPTACARLSILAPRCTSANLDASSDNMQPNQGPGSLPSPSKPADSKRRRASYAKHRRTILSKEIAGRPSLFHLKNKFPRQSTAFFIDQGGLVIMEEEEAIPVLDERSIITRRLERSDTAILQKQGHEFLPKVFEYLNQHELLCSASLVCARWAELTTHSLANMMLISVGCPPMSLTQSKQPLDQALSVKSSDNIPTNEDTLVDSIPELTTVQVTQSMDRSWSHLMQTYPWACFLSQGSFKQVYKVYNSSIQREEAISVMDVEFIESLGNKALVGAELATSVLLSSLARRNICPNFVLTRGVFTCRFAPPESKWGSEKLKEPQGKTFNPKCLNARPPRKPHHSKTGLYQYIRMELCLHGDCEDYIAKQPHKTLDPSLARHLLFQMAFSLYAASERFGLKHYDVKLLNFFLQDAATEGQEQVVLRYGLGEHVFRLELPQGKALVAKLADYGTCDTQPESDGKPVTIGQFTTLENTPPEQMILGNDAVQGYGHDLFALGLCMLHLYTGEAPYEEIMQNVKCPLEFKQRLASIWEEDIAADGTGDDEGSSSSSRPSYSVLRSVILSDVYTDEEGNQEGEVDETLYDTLYRYLVLFGIPDEHTCRRENNPVWSVILECFQTPHGRRRRRNNDTSQYHRDCKLFSVEKGIDERIARARRGMGPEGLELLKRLTHFDPTKRCTALEVLNSSHMLCLIEKYSSCAMQNHNFVVHSYMAYSLQNTHKA